LLMILHDYDLVFGLLRDVLMRPSCQD